MEEDIGVELGDVADAAKMASSLTKTLPGMVNTESAMSSGAPQICPECKQVIVSTQPAGAMEAESAMDKAGKAADCFGKFFNCFGKCLDVADKAQEIAGEK